MGNFIFLILTLIDIIVLFYPIIEEEVSNLNVTCENWIYIYTYIKRGHMYKNKHKDVLKATQISEFLLSFILIFVLFLFDESLTII